METLYTVSLIGVSVFAISGALAAGQRGFDLMGVLWIALVTALGGGTLRDLILNNTVFWVTDPNYIITGVVAALLTILYSRYFTPPFQSLLIADGLGLALFAISGAQLAEAQEVSSIIIILMGLFTGVVGGVLRDVLCREIPILFQADQTLYGTTAIIGIICYLFLQQLSLHQDTCALLGMIIVAALRFSAIFWKITLPQFKIREK